MKRDATLLVFADTDYDSPHNLSWNLDIDGGAIYVGPFAHYATAEQAERDAREAASYLGITITATEGLE